jgi:hypothetical protein
MKRLILAIILLFVIFPIKDVYAQSGCCSHHGGVCGCGCCDGTSLSITCAPYYPQCSQSTYTPAPVVTTPVAAPVTYTPIPAAAAQTLVPTPTQTSIVTQTSAVQGGLSKNTPTPSPTSSDSGSSPLGGIISLGILAILVYFLVRWFKKRKMNNQPITQDAATPTQEQEDMEKFLSILKEGNSPLMVSNVSGNILVKPDEKIYASILTNLFEPRSIRVGGAQGFSIPVPVLKGIYYHLGGFKAESHEEIRPIDSGVLTVTNQRLVFTGKTISLDIGLDKIISIEPFTDAIVLGRSDAQGQVYFRNIDSNNMAIKIDGREYNKKVDGAMLMCLIQGLVGKMK